jgi:DNA-binding beta-propeller fold protein YncE
VISGTTNAVLATLPAGDEPTAFCYSSSDRRIYWVNEWSHTVAAVDAATDVQVELIPLDGSVVQPVDIAYNSVSRRVYTANRLTSTIGVIPTAPAGCPADFDANGWVDGVDMGVLLAAWGTPTRDLNGDGQTDGVDLGILLGAWGQCGG